VAMNTGTERGLVTGGVSIATLGGIWWGIHSTAPDGVHFSAGSLAVNAILLVVLAVVVAYLFRLLLASKDAQIEELTRLAGRGTDVAERAVDRLAEQRGQP
jgi:membrane protein implicated in regulation of membrane protease activity